MVFDLFTDFSLVPAVGRVSLGPDNACRLLSAKIYFFVRTDNYVYGNRVRTSAEEDLAHSLCSFSSLPISFRPRSEFVPVAVRLRSSLLVLFSPKYSRPRAPLHSIVLGKTSSTLITW